MRFQQAQLDNGLTVVAEVNPTAASMAAGFFVRTGSRDEAPEVSGVSHFLEHMVFKGTETRTALDVNREFDDMGANYNAFTSEENTVYYGAVLPEYQSKLLELLSDILRPSLRSEDFDTEKQVILDEIALYEDQPRFRVYEKLMGLHFADHPLGNAILGTQESISGLQRDQMQAYFDARYSPGNVTVIGVGNLEFGRLVEDVRAHCSGWQPYDVERQTPEAATPARRETIVDDRLVRQNIGLMSAAPSAQSEQRFAAHVLATLIGDDTSSRLYYALVEPGLADDATTAYNPMDQAGVLMTSLSCDPDKAGQVLRIALEELERFRDEGCDDGELLAAQNKIASSATLKGEVPMGRLAAIGMDWVYARRYLTLEEQVERIFAVTADEVSELARRLDVARVDVLSLGPVEDLGMEA